MGLRPKPRVALPDFLASALLYYSLLLFPAVFAYDIFGFRFGL
jgi:hypothetical protein